ncbi:hypothetical protein MAR_028189 [Mya arenaria]|uniref:Uncharacterized protein n=1 Tax=Mya arenaria TaxID=6604 RepID=A0ABY7DDY8_MYAAR|nr:hypothetical protein MAR_028189 [Mya arenaria]
MWETSQFTVTHMFNNKIILMNIRNPNAKEEQRTATGGNKEQLTATGGDKEQRTATGGDKDKLTATGGDKEQRTATGGDKEQKTATGGDKEQKTATGGNKEQRTATGGDKEQRTATRGDKGFVYDDDKLFLEPAVHTDFPSADGQQPKIPHIIHQTLLHTTMQISPFAQAVGGTSCLLGLIYWLLTRRKRTSLKGKVVLITGANSGLGKGRHKKEKP